MVLLLPESPSFGQQLARGLGSGLSQSLGEGLKNIVAQKQRKNLIESIRGPKSSGQQLTPEQSESRDQQFIGLLQNLEQTTGQQLQPQDVDALWQQFNLAHEQQRLATPESPEKYLEEAEAFAIAKEPELMKTSIAKSELAHKQKKFEFEKEKAEKEILSIQPKQFLESVESYRKSQRDIDLALGAELQAVLSGEADPFSPGHIAEMAKQFGLPASVTAPFETVGSKEFRTGQKTFLSKTFKDAFRGATTQGQVELASSLLAESGAKREANLASIWLLQSQHLIEKERVRLTDEALDKGVSVYKLPRFVDRQLDRYAENINSQYFEAIKELKKTARKK